MAISAVGQQPPFFLQLRPVILNKRSISSSFPITSDYLFVHREHRVINGAKRRFQIAMRFENDHATFYDLINKPDDKKAFNNLLKGWGIDWDINFKEMTKRRRGREDGNDLPDFDVIVGPGIFVELSGADEGEHPKLGAKRLVFVFQIGY